MPIVERHWLRWHSKASTFRSRKLSTRSTWSGRSDSKSNSSCGSVWLEVLFRKEVGIARRDDGLDREQSGVAMVGMDAPDRPRIVPQDDVGLRAPDHRAHHRSSREAMTELTVDTVEELDVHRAQYLRRFSLLDPAGLDECTPVGRAVPGPFRPVGADAKCTTAPRSAHLARLAPHPNSMSSGCAPIARTRRGVGRSSVVVTPGSARFTRSGNGEIMVQA